MTRVAAVQVSGPADGGAVNRERTVHGAREAFAAGAEVVVLPELIVPGYGWDRDALAGGAEGLDGPTIEAWVGVAREAGGLVSGGFAERDGDALYNSAVLVDGDGVVLHYRKLHLFSGERDLLTPGDLGLPVASTAVGVIGLCVCYDLRFVETLRALALQGAELVCVPTAWVPGFDSELWDEQGFCPQARGALMQANLDQVAIACASQAGVRGGMRFLGSSIVADGSGRCLAGPSPGDGDDIAIADVDLAGHHDRGAGIRPRADRRTDVYGLALGDRRL